MATTARINLDFTASEAFDLALVHASDAAVQHALGPNKVSLGASSSPPVTKVWSGRVTLAIGEASINLAELGRGSTLPDVDLSGLKVQAIKLVTPATNTHAVVIAPGDSNGYALNGADDITLPPGTTLVLLCNGGLPTVGSGARLIDLTSTMATAVVDVMILAGIAA